MGRGTVLSDVGDYSSTMYQNNKVLKVGTRNERNNSSSWNPGWNEAKINYK